MWGLDQKHWRCEGTRTYSWSPLKTSARLRSCNRKLKHYVCGFSSPWVTGTSCPHQAFSAAGHLIRFPSGFSYPSHKPPEQGWRTSAPCAKPSGPPSSSLPPVVKMQSGAESPKRVNVGRGPLAISHSLSGSLTLVRIWVSYYESLFVPVLFPYFCVFPLT